MATFFWDQHGVVLIDFLEPGTTINKERYCLTLEKLKKAIQKKRNYRKVTIHHDNARPHTAHLTQTRIAEYGWTIMPHPPYSPDLAPSDFFLFGHLKRQLRGKKFETSTEVQTTVKRWAKSQEKGFFQGAFQTWRSRWEKCIENGGGYIE
jgi:[histone H3]-lysine36 N-dimethyltransferase SETMAR